MSIHDTELEETIHMLGGRVSIQKDFDKSKGWADQNLRAFRKRKCDIFHLEHTKAFMDPGVQPGDWLAV